MVNKVYVWQRYAVFVIPCKYLGSAEWILFDSTLHSVCKSQGSAESSVCTHLLPFLPVHPCRSLPPSPSGLGSTGSRRSKQSNRPTWTSLLCPRDPRPTLQAGVSVGDQPQDPDCWCILCSQHGNPLENNSTIVIQSHRLLEIKDNNLSPYYRRTFTCSLGLHWTW